MNRDDESAALAHQQELDERRRREDELLANDPDYIDWLDQLLTQLYKEEHERGHVEIRR